MHPEFLNALTDLATEHAEYFRLRGIAATLTARSQGRPTNSQALDLSHAKWTATLVVWDSGGVELTSITNKTGATRIRQQNYGTPEQMRSGLREWLFKHVRI
jgi:hypothetical protein